MERYEKNSICALHRKPDCEDLEKRKLYQILSDETATQEGYMRVIDESGEDNLYPESYFLLVDLPRQAEEVPVAAN